MNKKIILIALFSILAAISLGLFIYMRQAPAEIETAANTSPDANKPSNKTSNQPANLKPINALPKNAERDEKLQKQADALLNLFDNMPSVPIYVRDEPILKTGDEVKKGLAYAICENRVNPTIFIKKEFYKRANQKQLTNIIKHELTHAWFCRQGFQAEHDERFKKKFKSVGGFGN